MIEASELLTEYITVIFKQFKVNLKVGLKVESILNDHHKHWRTFKPNTFA